MQGSVMFIPPLKRVTLFFFVNAVTWILGCGGDDSKHLAEKENKRSLGDSSLIKDANFAAEAADGEMLEVSMGAYAKTNALLSSVKDLGAMMVKDHTKGESELAALANKYKLKIPQNLSARSQKEYAELMRYKGVDFDKAYSDIMVTDHASDIKAFQDEAAKGVNVEIRSWAAKQIPILKYHLEMSKAVAKQIAAYKKDPGK